MTSHFPLLYFSFYLISLQIVEDAISWNNKVL